MVKKCRCSYCGEQFESGTLKKKHKQKYPDGSCAGLFKKIITCNYCNAVFDSKEELKQHRRDNPTKQCRDKPLVEAYENYLKGGNENKMAIFKRNKLKPTAPPVEEEVVEEEEEEEEQVEEIEEETKAIKKEIARIKKPVEVPKEPEPEAEVEEELTEERVNQILKNHEMRLQKIEFNLRLVA